MIEAACGLLAVSRQTITIDAAPEVTAISQLKHRSPHLQQQQHDRFH